MAKNNTHADILRYALAHLEKERDAILEKIDHINSQLGNKVSAVAAVFAGASAAPRKKRTLSASARKRIAAAQKKRWAAHRKAQGKDAKE